MNKRIVDVIKVDNMLVDYLWHHKGKKNTVSSKQIAEFLTSSGYPTSAKNVGWKVRKIMIERHLPICHLNSYGYFWASNKVELLESVSDLKNRIAAMSERIEHLQSFIFD